MCPPEGLLLCFLSPSVLSVAVSPAYLPFLAAISASGFSPLPTVRREDGKETLFSFSKEKKCTKGRWETDGRSPRVRRGSRWARGGEPHSNLVGKLISDLQFIFLLSPAREKSDVTDDRIGEEHSFSASVCFPLADSGEKGQGGGGGDGISESTRGGGGSLENEPRSRLSDLKGPSSSSSSFPSSPFPGTFFATFLESFPLSTLEY